MQEAEQAQQQFAHALRQSAGGPLHDRLAEIDERIVTGVQECWRVAQAGNDLTIARSDIDVRRHHPAAGRARPAARHRRSRAAPLAGTLEALDAQLGSRAAWTA